MNLSGTALLLLLLMLAALPVQAQSTLPAKAFPDLAFQQHPGAALPDDVRLRDDQGRTVVTGDLFDKGKPVVLVFDYFRCTTLCGLVLGDLSAALSQVPLKPGRDYDVVAVSIDPRETPKDAAAAEVPPLRPRPRLRRSNPFPGRGGSRSAASRRDGRVPLSLRSRPSSSTPIRPASPWYRPAARISRYILGIGYDPLDLRLGLIDASRGSIASVSDQLLLLCYAYDPAHGKYSLVIGNVVRAGGIATVVALGLLICSSRTGDGCPADEPGHPLPSGNRIGPCRRNELAVRRPARHQRHDPGAGVRPDGGVLRALPAQQPG